MTRHPSQEELIATYFEASPDIERHLKECALCRERAEKIKAALREAEVHLKEALVDEADFYRSQKATIMKRLSGHTAGAKDIIGHIGSLFRWARTYLPAPVAAAVIAVSAALILFFTIYPARQAKTPVAIETAAMPGADQQISVESFGELMPFGIWTMSTASGQKEETDSASDELAASPLADINGMLEAFGVWKISENNNI